MGTTPETVRSAQAAAEALLIRRLDVDAQIQNVPQRLPVQTEETFDEDHRARRGLQGDRN